MINAEVKKSINKTYEIMRQNRMNLEPEEDLKKCNGCGRYCSEDESRLIKYGKKNYRYCYNCRKE